nr:MAG TPA: hypothetical protein [Caudoviricetes sp.]
MPFLISLPISPFRITKILTSIFTIIILLSYLF